MYGATVAYMRPHFSSFFLGAGSCTISQISQLWAPFWKALLLGYRTHLLALIKACAKKDLGVIESQWM